MLKDLLEGTLRLIEGDEEKMSVADLKLKLRMARATLTLLILILGKDKKET